MRNTALLLLFVVGCSDDIASDPRVYALAPGARLNVARFTVTDGACVDFTVTGARGQPVSVGLGYEGPVTPHDPHHSYGWYGATDADPYVDSTPAPLIAGAYRIDLGCGAEAAKPCVFSFHAEVSP